MLDLEISLEDIGVPGRASASLARLHITNVGQLVRRFNELEAEIQLHGTINVQSKNNNLGRDTWNLVTKKLQAYLNTGEVSQRTEHRPGNNPTPEEIAKACEETRAGWDRARWREYEAAPIVFGEIEDPFREFKRKGKT